jgi:mRNA interferase MazF
VDLVADAAPAQGSVYLIALDPARGSEIQKTRPCLIVSPDRLNRPMRTVIVAPMTTGGQPYPWRVECEFQGQTGRIALDQLRTVDRERLVRLLGVLPRPVVEQALRTLSLFFQT